MYTLPPSLDALIRLNTQDMLDSFGLGRVRTGRRLLDWACRRPARRFAEIVLEFDRRIAAEDLSRAAAWGVRQFDAAVEIRHPERIPSAGPALFLSNHPGITDTLALFSALGRADLHTVAAIRPFLTALDNMSRRLIYVDESAGANLGVVRGVTQHLRAGRAVLTFPAGKIEPDPAVLPGAAAALAAWSDSISLFVRLAPTVLIVPVLVSGVYSAASLHSPFTYLRRTQKDRERFAAMLQIVAPQRYPVRVQVTIGSPMSGASLPAGGEAGGVKAAVIATMRDLMAEVAAKGSPQAPDEQNAARYP